MDTDDLINAQTPAELRLARLGNRNGSEPTSPQTEAPAACPNSDELSKRLGTLTAQAAIRAAVQITERLLDYKDRGYQIAVVENGHHIHAPDAPTRSWTPIEQWIQDTLHSKPH